MSNYKLWINFVISNVRYLEDRNHVILPSDALKELEVLNCEDIISTMINIYILFMKQN